MHLCFHFFCCDPSFLDLQVQVFDKIGESILVHVNLDFQLFLTLVKAFVLLLDFVLDASELLLANALFQIYLRLNEFYFLEEVFLVAIEQAFLCFSCFDQFRNAQLQAIRDVVPLFILYQTFQLVKLEVNHAQACRWGRLLRN